MSSLLDKVFRKNFLLYQLFCDAAVPKTEPGWVASTACYPGGHIPQVGAIHFFSYS